MKGWAEPRVRFRPVLSLVLSVALAAGHPLAARGAGAGGSETDGVRVYGNGEEVFRLDYGDALRGGADVLRDGGEFAVSLSRAVFPSAGGGSEWLERGFVFGEGRSADSIVDLGTAPEQALRSAGRQTVRPSRWDEVVRWSVTSTARTVTSTFRAGPDWMSLTVPRELLEADGAVAPGRHIVTVEANGIAARVDAALLRGPDAAQSCAGLRAALASREARALRDIADSFIDLPGFLNRVRGYLEIERQARVRQAIDLLPGDEDPEPSSCTTLCLSCAGALLASVGAYVALVSTCGGALVTGGTTAVLCIASFIGVQSSHLIVFASCARCVECAGEPDCPCEGEPLCDCG